MRRLLALLAAVLFLGGGGSAAISGPQAVESPRALAGQLLGHQWQPRELAQFNYEAGWQDAQTLVVSVAVELAESQGFDHAININPNGTRDRGVWQLNSIHTAFTDAIAYDPVKATTAAFSLYLSRGSSFDDWAAYTTGVFLHDSYIGRAAVGVANYLGDLLLRESVPPWLGKPYVHHFTTPVANFQFRVGTQLYYNQQAAKRLGFSAATKAKVAEVQHLLAQGRLIVNRTTPP